MFEGSASISIVADRRIAYRWHWIRSSPWLGLTRTLFFFKKNGDSVGRGILVSALNFCISNLAIQYIQSTTLCVHSPRVVSAHRCLGIFFPRLLNDSPTPTISHVDIDSNDILRRPTHEPSSAVCNFWSSSVFHERIYVLVSHSK